MKRRMLLSLMLLYLVIAATSGIAATKSLPAAAPPKPDMVQLTVTQGDSLYNICGQYLDSANRWQEIARINRLQDPHRLQPGLKIWAPVAYLKSTPVAGSVIFVQGDAKARIGGQGDWINLKTGDLIPPKSQLKTGDESALEVVYDDGGAFLLRSNTDLGVMNSQKTVTSDMLRDLFLNVGRVISNVREATGKASRYRVHTPGAIASVRGTDFRVAVDELEKTFTEVMENLVSVSAADKSVELAGGEGTVVKKGEPPLPPRRLPAPPDPVDLKTIYNTEPTISFTMIEGATAYRIMVAKDRQGKHLVREKIIKPQDAFRIAGPADGDYYLSAQSIDAIGLEGIPSLAQPFTIRLNPLPPFIQSPRAGAKIKGNAASFEWLSVGDAMRYHVQIGEDREFTKPAVDKNDLTRLSFKADTLAHKPQYFRISSIAKDGYQGAWSDPLPFELVPMPPIPAAEPPAVSKDEINLRARSAGEGFVYHFQIARDDQFKEMYLDRKEDKPEITIKKPKEAGKYYVRMAAIDRDGDTGEFSAPQSFEIKQRLPYEWFGGGLGLLIILLLAIH